MKKFLKTFLTLIILGGLMALPGLIPSQMQSVQAENLQQEETPVVPTDPPGTATRPLLYIQSYQTRDGGYKNVSPWEGCGADAALVDALRLSDEKKSGRCRKESRTP